VVLELVLLLLLLVVESGRIAGGVCGVLHVLFSPHNAKATPFRSRGDRSSCGRSEVKKEQQRSCPKLGQYKLWSLPYCSHFPAVCAPDPATTTPTMLIKVGHYESSHDECMLSVMSGKTCSRGLKID